MRKTLAVISAFALLSLVAGDNAVAEDKAIPRAAPRPASMNAELVSTSPLLKRLDADSALFEKINAQTVLSRGSLAGGFQTKTVQLESGKNAPLGTLTRGLFAEQNAFAQKARAVAPSSGILLRPVEVKDEALEFEDAYAVVQTTQVIVSDPRRFAELSPEFGEYLGDPQIPAGLTRASLEPESRAGYEDFLAHELPQLAADDPIRRAYETGGDEALLRAVAEGKGLFEVTDTVIIPKTFEPVINGRLQKPVRFNNIVRYDRFEPSSEEADRDGDDAPAATPRRESVEEQPGPAADSRPREPSVTTSGRDDFRTEFIAGFTKGKSWEWERRWRYPSGFFRVSLRGRYGVGLRIPIEINGTLSPTQITVVDSLDQTVPVRTSLAARTLDADAAFYRRAGMPENKLFSGREAVCEAGFGWGMKFRALWTDIKHVRMHDIASFSMSQDFKPPFGNDRDAYYRLEIPPSLTGTEFNWAVVSGFAQAGLRFDGKGTVTVDYEPFTGDRELEKRTVRFTDDTRQNLDVLLPPIRMASNRPIRRESYGFSLTRPSYRVDLSMTPEVRARVHVGYSWVSHTFNTGWIALDSFKVDLGTVELGRHSGTRRRYVYTDGRKTYEKIETASGDAASFEAALIAVQSNKYVRAGIGQNQTLAAASDHGLAWETFVITRIGPDLVTLKSRQNGRYVRIGVRENGAERLGAVSARADVLETFRLRELGGGIITLQALRNNKYVRAGLGDISYLGAVSDAVGGWEKFRLVRLNEPAPAAAPAPARAAAPPRVDTAPVRPATATPAITTKPVIKPITFNYSPQQPSKPITLKPSATKITWPSKKTATTQTDKD